MTNASLDREMVREIQHWKEQRNAVILAHNYQLPEIQDIADVVGDSLTLAREASKAQADTIVLCGVHFMAETAVILNPTKMVLLPDQEAGCSLADSITIQQLREWKQEYPQAVVVSYVNTPAEIKAESDYCCTSSNAVAVVQAIPDDQEILFLPDFFLGSYVKKMTHRDNLHIWMGECHVHAGITPYQFGNVMEQHPEAELLVHPECGCSTSNLYMFADGTLPVQRTRILSTGGMLTHAQNSSAEEFIVATEVGILYQLEQQNQGKRFLPANPEAICPFMKKITLSKVLRALRDQQFVITVEDEIAKRAKVAIDRMIAIGN
jgi:quinolinate synthase